VRAARILARGRTLAAEFMTDRCVIGTRSSDQVLNPDTLEYEYVFTEVYSGPCRFKAGNVQASDVESATQLLVTQLATLSLPIDGSGDVRNGMLVRITESATDPALPGTEATIKAPFKSSYATARRFASEVTSG
jgi:hypothetical protein